MDYLAVRIGVPTEAAARSLSRRLVEERLVAGTRLTHGPSHYWWDGAVQEREYWTITGYTTAERRDALTARITDLHSDEVPGITFTEIDVPPAYLEERKGIYGELTVGVYPEDELSPIAIEGSTDRAQVSFGLSVDEARMVAEQLSNAVDEVNKCDSHHERYD